jgi:hypothetical protein
MISGRLRLAETTPTVLLPLLASFYCLAADAARPPYQYRPFIGPAPLWGDHVWPLLLLPLCVGVAIVYKSVKCQHMRQVPRQALVLSLWILAGMALAAVVLALIVEGLERGNT